MEEPQHEGHWGGAGGSARAIFLGTHIPLHKLYSQLFWQFMYIYIEVSIIQTAVHHWLVHHRTSCSRLPAPQSFCGTRISQTWLLRGYAWVWTSRFVLIYFSLFCTCYWELGVGRQADFLRPKDHLGVENPELVWILLLMETLLLYLGHQKQHEYIN